MIKCKNVNQPVLIPKWIKEKWSRCPLLKTEGIFSSVIWPRVFSFLHLVHWGCVWMQERGKSCYPAGSRLLDELVGTALPLKDHWRGFGFLVGLFVYFVSLSVNLLLKEECLFVAGVMFRISPTLGMWWRSQPLPLSRLWTRWWVHRGWVWTIWFFCLGTCWSDPESTSVLQLATCFSVLFFPVVCATTLGGDTSLMLCIRLLLTF